MHRITYRINTLSPVIIANSGEGNMIATKDTISGTAVRGLLATRFLEQHPKDKAHEDEHFQKLFLQNKIRFGYAYPIKTIDFTEKVFYPTPLSIQQDKAEERIYNLVVTDSAEELTKSVGGCVCLEEKNGQSLLTKQIINKRLYFHHFKPHRLKSSTDENAAVFTYEALQEGQAFTGELYGSKQELDILIEKLGNSFCGRLGRSRQTQYGSVKITLGQPKIIQNEPDQSPELQSCHQVILNIMSPLILLNHFGFPAYSEDSLVSYLQEHFGDSKFTIINRFIRFEQVENHVGVWNLPRPNALAVTAGSVFVLQFAEGITGLIAEKLLELQVYGLGERRDEGFGSVALNWAAAAHYQKAAPSGKSAVNAPKDQPPALLCSILTSISRQKLLVSIEQEAIETANEFYEHTRSQHRPSTSLLGRLELFLREANNARDFQEKLNDLKEVAKEKLHSCRNKNTKMTLFDALNLDAQKIVQLGQLNSDYTVLAQMAGWKYMEDKSFHFQCYQTYWLSFLRMLRKLNKKGVN